MLLSCSHGAETPAHLSVPGDGAPVEPGRMAEAGYMPQHARCVRVRPVTR